MHQLQHPQISGDAYFVHAYAKINLTLDVLGRRQDGYHELVTIMQTIDLYDTLCLTTIEDDTVQMVCTTPELSNTNNLAARAAQLVRERFALTQGLRIELHKRIPQAAGLGGGSSDAAAILRALQQWWKLPLTTADTLALATSLGSDVPFFLDGGLALCRGRGEHITQLPFPWPAAMRWLLILKPALSLSTARVFRDLPASDYTNGSHSQAVGAALQAKNVPELADLHNGLERGVLEQYPEVAQAREALLQAGAPFARLSGSGPTLFTAFPTLIQASQAQSTLQTRGYEVYLSHALHPNENRT